MGEEGPRPHLPAEIDEVLVRPGGEMSRYTPGSGRSAYQPIPNPSPLVSVFPSSACSDWCTSEWVGAQTRSERKTGSPL